MRLPLIPTPQAAADLAEQQHDRFYLAAFRLQVWLSELSIQAVAEYANKANPADRSMQTGQAWRAFFSVLGRVRDKKFHHVIRCLGRFSECENPLSSLLLSAFAPLHVEHQFYGDFLGPKAPQFSDDPGKAALLMRRSVQRLCDWLEAIIHLQTHSLWFTVPACFDSDPEKRRSAALQLSQPYAAQMNDPSALCAYVQEPTPTPRFPAPPIRSIPERSWPFPILDEALIAVWPLLKLHNWTYRQLWNVVREAGIQPEAPPCQSSRLLAVYCANTLGLRKTGHGHTAGPAKPAGHALAVHLCRPPCSPSFGHAPWS